MAGPKWLLLALLSSTLFVPACKSTDHPDGDEGALKADASALASKDGCAAAPKLPVCCEAMTPTCNECRDTNVKTMDAWRVACLKPTETPIDCASPPVTACPNDGSSAARDCRQEALNQLMTWRDKCATEGDAVTCDKKPTVTACCMAMIPSCEACRARNDRTVADWQRRCAK